MKGPVICPAALSIVFAAWAAPAGELTVTITGAGAEGEIRVMVFGDAAGFERLEHPVAAFALPPRDGRITQRLSGLAPGLYAVAAFQDVNGDLKLDKSFFGVPTEPCGFSNDAAAVFGPPGFDAAAFTVGPADTEITFRLR